MLMIVLSDWETHLVLFDRSGSSGTIDVKVDGSLIDEE